MSVPAGRMAPAPVQSDRIMGLKKPVFWAIIVVGIILAYWIYKHSQANSAASQPAADAANPTTDQGLTAADVGGIPQDNSLGTVTDEMALEQQIQQLQNSMSQLQNAPAGSTTGSGLPTGLNPGGSTGSVSPTPTGNAFTQWPEINPLPVATGSNPSTVPETTNAGGITSASNGGLPIMEPVQNPPPATIATAPTPSTNPVVAGSPQITSQIGSGGSRAVVGAQGLI